MKVLTLSLYFGLLLLETAHQVYALDEKQVRQDNKLHQPAVVIDQAQFPLFPQEPELNSFPDVVNHDSTPQDLKNYYQSVAHAYGNWADEQKKSAQAAQVRLMRSQEAAFWQDTRTSDFKSYSSRTSAHYQTVMYHQDQYTNENNKLQSIIEKTKFYQELANHYENMANTQKEPS